MNAKESLRGLCVEFSGFCDIFNRAKEAQWTQRKRCDTYALKFADTAIFNI